MKEYMKIEEDLKIKISDLVTSLRLKEVTMEQMKETIGCLELDNRSLKKDIEYLTI